jgi:2-methylisocitrate lyase-like PEP mutase family enzyme
MAESASRKLRGLLADDGMVVAPGCHDALGARLVQAEGYEAVYVSGNAAGAGRIGRPDIGLITQTEMVTHARGIASAVTIPAISDADTGYGDAASIARTVREFEAAGIAAIHIEDQALPKKCGAMPGVRLVSRDEACARLSDALAARTDPDFVIIGRTDALAVDDYDEAMWRARAFHDLGADLVMVEDMRSAEDVTNVARDLAGIPLLTDVLEFWPWTLRTVEELEAIGYKLAIFALSATLAYGHSVRTLLRTLRTSGSTAGFVDRMLAQAEYEELLGLQEDGTVDPNSFTSAAKR